MHLNIKSDEAHRLERGQGSQQRAIIVEKLLAIGAWYSALPDRDARPPDEIIGYDENGAPS